MYDNNDNTTSKVVDNDSNCLHDTSNSNESSSFLKGSSSHDNSKDLFNWLNRHKYYYYISSHNKIGFISHKTDDIPVTLQFQIPSSCQLNMSPHELELMLFINENFLSPSIFDKVMKWACSANANGCKFDSPSYSMLKKWMYYTSPNTINGDGLYNLSKKFLVVPKLLYTFPTVPNLQQVYASSANHHGVSAWLQLWSSISTTKSCHASEVFSRAC